jgi:formate dehydrogenase major subunit
MKFWRLPTLYKSMQEKVKDISKDYPLVMTSGRLVEYEGGGEETRSNPWLAELQQDMFVEINPKDANDRGIPQWRVHLGRVAHQGEIKVRRRSPSAWRRARSSCPFHFAGWWQGKDMLEFYPAGAAPVVRGEAVNTATTYGYDSVTMMQETKTTLCQVSKA